MRAGREEPLGAHARDGGVNFAVFSQHAHRVEVCVFDASGARELKRYALDGPHDGLWSGFLEGVGPGLVYGLRAHGPYAPEAGHRFNPHKLLLDPCAREIVGRFRWAAEHHGYEPGHPDGTRSFDTRDSAAHMLKARVAAPAAPRQRPPRPMIAAPDVVLYEVHVKGFSMQLPGVPDALRGTYAGLAHPASLAHLRQLGVTTLSLLPVHHHLDEPAVAARGLVNYWGYNTLGFFCPDPRLACAAHRDDPTAVNEEFRQMVDTLHAHGLEVVLDVVYNHTAEGNEHGSTLSFRGLDNASWYRLAADDRSRCDDVTGCGNTVNVAHPRVTQFVMDSLRHWVQDMGVDGFRFDLAPVLGRTAHGFDLHAPFFAAALQDPVLAGVHLIAEAWDSGHGGYQVGRFPGRWKEWNDKFRDTVRRYWLGRGVSRGEFARRFTASSDLFHHGQRRPLSSVNFITAHDGFTLADLTSYSRKHNAANGEDGRDGRDGEPCAHGGVEGPTHDAAVLGLRNRWRRAMLATLALAQGTPMLCGGDEIANTQHGNNNAYCQDNPTGWIGWTEADRGLLAFACDALALRRSEPALRHPRWFHGGPALPGEPRLVWCKASGQEMHVHDWHDGAEHAFGCRIETDTPAEGTAPAGTHRLHLMFNPEPASVTFVLVPGRWELALDSSGELRHGLLGPGQRSLHVPAHSLVVLRTTRPDTPAHAP